MMSTVKKPPTEADFHFLFRVSVICIFFASFVGVCGGLWIGACAAEAKWQVRLVNEGMGRWVVDEKTGAREFKVGPRP